MSSTTGEELTSDQPNQSACELKRQIQSLLMSLSRDSVLYLSEFGNFFCNYPGNREYHILEKFCCHWVDWIYVRNFLVGLMNRFWGTVNINVIQDFFLLPLLVRYKHISLCAVHCVIYHIICSEFEDASLERPRILGGLSSQGFRRNEYGSSPPTRGELGNFGQGIHGRWDSRSSGRTEKDVDSQSDRDSGMV